VNETSEQTSKPHWFTDYRDYWTGIIIMNLVLGFVKYLTTPRLLTTLTELLSALSYDFTFAFIGNLLMSLIIFLISWLFKRNFTQLRFMKIFATWTFINLLMNII